MRVILIIALSLIALIHVIGVNLTIPSVTALATDLNTSIPATGQILTATMLASLVGLAFAGPINARFGYRLVGAVSLGATALLTIGSAWMTSYWSLVVVRALAGLGISLLMPTAFAAAGDFFRGSMRATALGWINATIGLGLGLGLGLLAMATAAWGWRLSFLSFAGAALVTLFIWLAAVPPLSPGSAGRARGAGGWQTVLHHLRSDWKAVGILVADFLAAVLYTGGRAFVAPYFQDVHRIGLDQTGRILAVDGFLYFAGAVLAPRLLYRFGPRSTTLGAILASSVATPILALGLGGSPTSILLIWVTALLRGLIMVGISDLSQDIAPSVRSTSQAIRILVLQAGHTVAPVVGGLALGFAGYAGWGWTLCTAGLIASAALVPRQAPPLAKTDRTASAAPDQHQSRPGGMSHVIVGPPRTPQCAQLPAEGGVH